MHTATEREHVTPEDEVRPTDAGTPLMDETTQAAAYHRYPPSAFRGPLFETRDRIALVMATAMLLGPLAALPLGL